MQISKKTALWIFFSVSILIGAIFLISMLTLRHGFMILEERQVQKNIARARDTFSERVRQIEIQVTDWAVWDDTYNFMEDRSQSFINSAFNDTMPDSLRLEVTGVFREFSRLIESLQNGSEQLSNDTFLILLISGKELRAGEMALLQGICPENRLRLILISSNNQIEGPEAAQRLGYQKLLPALFTRRQIFSAVVGSCCAELPDGGVYAADNTVETVNLAGCQILVVEDDMGSRRLLEEILEKIGAVCKFARNGQEAVEVLRVQNFDLCLMDVQMPLMDGLTATRIIRGEISETLPIIGLSAAVMKEDRENAIAAGMNDYLIKPLDNSALRCCLNKFCPKKS